MAYEEEKPWERRQGESEQAFEAFTVYRNMGLKRSNRAVCEKLSKSRQLISRWKSKYEWDIRAKAWDNELEEEARAEAANNLKDMTNRHIRISMKLQEKALEALMGLDSKKLSPKDIKEILKMATDLERLNRTYVAKDNDKFNDNDGSVQLYIPDNKRG